MEFIGFVWTASLIGSLIAPDPAIDPTTTRPDSWQEDLAAAIAHLRQQGTRNMTKPPHLPHPPSSHSQFQRDRSLAQSRVRRHPQLSELSEVAMSYWADKVMWTEGVSLDVKSASVNVAVVPVTASPHALDMNAGMNHINAGVNLCTLPASASPSFSEDSTSQGFQVQVNGYPVAALPDRERAEAIAQYWETLLTTPEFSVNALEPTMVNNRPAGRSGDHLLFTISPNLEKELASNGELLAIAWVNNLRTALGTLPLSLTDAQVQMYDLTPTQQSLQGIASWYGPYFHGRLTATGESFDQNALTAAHPTLPFDTHLLVTNLETGQSVVVRINDRGPYIGRRSLDLSRAAARCIGSEHDGVVPYEAIVLDIDADAEAPTFPFTIPLDGEVPELARS